MNALLAILALAAQVVTVKPADLPDKPVYVRVGVGVESRILLPDALLRLHGQRSSAETLGLKLGQARPQALLLFRPREAGTGKFQFVGPRHELKLVIEASVLGSALDVELRIAEPEQESALTVSPRIERAADETAPDILPTRALSVDLRPPTPAVRAADVTLRPRRRVGRPGQRAIFIEEVRRESGRASLRLRVERAARCHVVAFEIDGRPVQLANDVDGRDLVAIATLPEGARQQARHATLVLAEGRHLTRVSLPLDAHDIYRLFAGGTS